MRSLRPLVFAALFVVTACSGGSDAAVEVPTPDPTGEVASDSADTESAEPTDPTDAGAETGSDAESEPVVGDEGSGESDGAETDTAASGGVVPDGDAAGDANGGDANGDANGEADGDSTDGDSAGETDDSEGDGFTIDGPARVRPSCASLTPGVNEFTVDSGGLEYDVRLFVPSAASSDPAPVVLNWHGLGSNGPEQAMYTGYETLAEQEGFIAVHATGQESSWELAQFDTPERDDLAFADALIDTVVEDWCGDADRIYSTGMSNGGLFTSNLVCNLSDRIAAAASIAGTTHPEQCDPDRPVPYVAYHGTADTVVPFDGDDESILLPPESIEALIGDGTPDQFAEFAADNGCDPEPELTQLTVEVNRYDYTNCENDIPMTFYEIIDGGHTWPSSPIADPAAGLAASGFTFDVDATADAWAFMSQFSL